MFRIYDMIRATIIAKNLSDMVNAYELIARTPAFNIIRIQNKFNTSYKKIELNLIYMNRIICEIVI